MYSFVSDVDTINDKPAVEWESIYGGRNWQTYKSDVELEAAIKKNQAYNDLHQEHIDAILKEQDEQWLHMLMLDLEKDPTDTMCLSDHELNRVKEYRERLIAKHSA